MGVDGNSLHMHSQPTWVFCLAIATKSVFNEVNYLSGYLVMKAA